MKKKLSEQKKLPKTFLLNLFTFGLVCSQIVHFGTMEYVCWVVLKLSNCDVIVSQKGSSGDGKLHFYGWGYSVRVIKSELEHLKERVFLMVANLLHCTKRA